MTAGGRRRGRGPDVSAPPTTNTEDTMPTFTVTSDAGLDAIWAQHLAADRCAREAGQAAASLERDADRLRSEATALRNRAEQILIEVKQKEDTKQDLLRRAEDARREENRHIDVARQMEATVDAQATGNPDLTHPRERLPQQAAQAVIDAIVPDPLTAPVGSLPIHTGDPRTGTAIADALVANGADRPTQAMSAAEVNGSAP
ncbi:MAG: hypothetical protein JWO67_1561 [Streptosporangiaceae bacterium]|nr:hypothetical protein [Streptosporangiaceae bacterium]